MTDRLSSLSLPSHNLDCRRLLLFYLCSCFPLLGSATSFGHPSDVERFTSTYTHALHFTHDKLKARTPAFTSGSFLATVYVPAVPASSCRASRPFPRCAHPTTALRRWPRRRVPGPSNLAISRTSTTNRGSVSETLIRVSFWLSLNLNFWLTLCFLLSAFALRWASRTSQETHIGALDLGFPPKPVFKSARCCSSCAQSLLLTLVHSFTSAALIRRPALRISRARSRPITHAPHAPRPRLRPRHAARRTARTPSPLCPPCPPSLGTHSAYSPVSAASDCGHRVHCALAVGCRRLLFLLLNISSLIACCLFFCLPISSAAATEHYSRQTHPHSLPFLPLWTKPSRPCLPRAEVCPEPSSR